MRKHIITISSVALAIMAISCNEKVSPVVSEGKVEKITLKTVMPEFTGDENLTRTHLDISDLSVKWDEDDIIATGYSKTVFNTFSITETNGPSATFEGEINRSQYENTEFPELFIYPASAVTGADFIKSDAVKCESVNFPTIQKLTPDSFAKGCNVAAASYDIHSEGNELHFVNLCALLAVNLKGNAKIKKIKIQHVGNRAMTGQVKVKNRSKGQGQNADFYLYGMSGNQWVTLEAEEAINLADYKDGVKFYAAVVGDHNKTTFPKVEMNSLGANASEFDVYITDENNVTIQTTTSGVVNQQPMPGKIIRIGEWEVNKSMFEAVQAR